MKFRILTGHKTTIIELKEWIRLATVSFVLKSEKFQIQLNRKIEKTERPLLNFLSIVF